MPPEASTVSTPLSQRICAELEAVGSRHTETHARTERRRHLLAQALAAGLPGGRDEGFRYTQLRPLEKLAFSPARPATDAAVRAAALLPQPLPGFTRVVFIDGYLCAELSSEPARLLASDATVRLPQLLLSRVADTDSTLLEAAGPVVPAGRRFALINAAFADETLHIEVAAGADPARVELLFLSLQEGAQGASYPRVAVRCAPHATLQLVERFAGAADTATFSNASIELDLADGARCSHYRVQALGLRAMHIETLGAALHAAAHYDLHSLHAGAASARSTVAIDLLGAQASAAVHAAQVAGTTQSIDAQVTVEHHGPATTTVETFRGIAAQRARIAFNGHMIVRETARGADTRQSLRCLLAGPDTEADVRPQLEIYTDEVRASHGATVGKLDENMLFYLLSRGIDRDTAQSLLKWAFLAEVLTRIDIPQLRQDAQQLVFGRVQGLIGEALS